MDETEQNRKKLDDIVQKVIAHSESYYNQMAQINTVTSNLKKLIDEEAYLKNQISEEEKFHDQLNETIRVLEQKNIENQMLYKNALNRFKEEAYKNTQLSKMQNEVPWVFDFGFEGSSPLIHSIRNKSRLLKEKADLVKKYNKLCRLQKNVYCLDDEDDNLFLLNPEIDYSNFQTKNFNESVRKSMIDACRLNNVSNQPNIFFSTYGKLTAQLSSQISPPQQPNNEFPLLMYSFTQAPKTNQIEENNYISQYCQHFSNVNSKSFNELISKVENTLTTLFSIFSLEHKKIEIAAENFFERNPNFRNSSSVLCSDVVFEAQDQILDVQHTAFLLSQAILPPDTKVITESYRIKTLLNELVSIFDRLYDRLSRNQIIGSNITLNSPQIESFQIDETSHAQLEQCNSIVNELKEIFKNNFDIQQKFLGDLNGLLATSKDVQEMRSEIDIDLEISPPVEIDDSEKRESFLKLKEQILKAQSEQLDLFRESLDSLPDDLRQIIPLNERPEIKVDNEEIHSIETKIESNETKVQANEAENNSNEAEVNAKETEIDVEKPGIDFNSQNYDFDNIDLSLNIQQTKSNPFSDSNQNLIEKVIRKNTESLAFSGIPNNFDTFHFDDKYHTFAESLSNGLVSSVSEESIDDLLKIRDQKLQELNQKKLELSAFLTQKNERSRKKLLEMKKVQQEKAKRENLYIEVQQNQTKLHKASINLPKIKDEIQTLRNEREKLTDNLKNAENMAETLTKIMAEIREIDEEEKQFDAECEADEKEFLKEISSKEIQKPPCLDA